ncbi:MAG: DUF3999 family protein [Thermodesulfobacteriota bacterium]
MPRGHGRGAAVSLGLPPAGDAHEEIPGTASPAAGRLAPRQLRPGRRPGARGFRRRPAPGGPGEGPLFEVPVPVAVYLGSVQPDLRDVQVFNALGEAVPTALRPPLAPGRAEAAVALPHPPLPGHPEEEPSAAIAQRVRTGGGRLAVVGSRGLGTGGPHGWPVLRSGGPDCQPPQIGGKL